MTFIDLPSEILSSIVSLLDIPSAIRCQLVCKKLHQVASSEPLLKDFCHRLAFLECGKTLEDLRRPHIGPGTTATSKAVADGHKYSAWRLSGRSESELESYASLLSSSWRLYHVKERADLSYAGGTNYSYSIEPIEPWRIKIDPIDNVILATSLAGGKMEAIRMEDGASLVSHRGDHFLPYAHLECDQGWLAHSINDTTFSISCMERNADIADPQRGRCMSGEKLTAKHPIRAYRLIFPHLLVGSSEGYATLYDIISKQVVLDIKLRGVAGLGRIRYVEFDEDYIWVILSGSRTEAGTLQTYCRHTGHFVWDLSPQSGLVQNAYIRRFPHFMNSHDDDGLTSCAPGRAEQLLEEYSVLHSARRREEKILLQSLCEWDAVHPDSKTGSLCLLSGCTLVVIPDYKNFVKRFEERDEEADEEDSDDHSWSMPFRMVHDASPPQRRHHPFWVRARPDGKQPYLAVADGRAAFVAQNGVALVDLQKLFAHPGSEYDAHLDALGRDDPPGYLYYERSVNVFSSPYIFNSDMQNCSCLALTSTHLAWVGSYQILKAHEIPESLQHQDINCKNFYISGQSLAVMWIDFGKLRDKAPDTRREEEEKSRAACLDACKREMHRRIATSDDAKYTLLNGREIENIESTCDGTMATVETLLMAGEFCDVNRWIDWSAFEKVRGTEAATEYRQRVTDWEERGEHDMLYDFHSTTPWELSRGDAEQRYGLTQGHWLNAFLDELEEEDWDSEDGTEFGDGVIVDDEEMTETEDGDDDDNEEEDGEDDMDDDSETE